jgi:hypothetical protein
MILFEMLHIGKTLLDENERVRRFATDPKAPLGVSAGRPSATALATLGRGGKNRPDSGP